MRNAAGIVLAGGRSSRMGTPKAALEWHGSTLLRRTTGILARAVGGPVAVVRAPAQPIPPLGHGVEVHDDPREGLGPLQGLAAALAAVGDRAETAFVCSVDLPFLHSVFVRRVLAGFDEVTPAGDVDVVLPHAHGHPQPLAAGYRTSLAAVVDRLVAVGQLRPAFLFAECRVRRLDAATLLADAALAAADPDLDSLLNVNTPEDYRAARARPAPTVSVECFGVRAAAAAGERRMVHAATLGAAAASVRLRLDDDVTATVDGEPPVDGAQTPLLPGDAVVFRSADSRREGR